MPDGVLVATGGNGAIAVREAQNLNRLYVGDRNGVQVVFENQTAAPGGGTFSSVLPPSDENLYVVSPTLAFFRAFVVNTDSGAEFRHYRWHDGELQRLIPPEGAEYDISRRDHKGGFLASRLLSSESKEHWITDGLVHGTPVVLHPRAQVQGITADGSFLIREGFFIDDFFEVSEVYFVGTRSEQIASSFLTPSGDLKDTGTLVGVLGVNSLGDVVTHTRFFSPDTSSFAVLELHRADGGSEVIAEEGGVYASVPFPATPFRSFITTDREALFEAELTGGGKSGVFFGPSGEPDRFGSQIDPAFGKPGIVTSFNFLQSHGDGPIVVRIGFDDNTSAIGVAIREAVEDCPFAKQDDDCDIFFQPGVQSSFLEDGENWAGGEAPVDRGDGCQNAFFQGVDALLTFGSVGYNGLFVRGDGTDIVLQGTQMTLGGFIPEFCPFRPSLGIGAGSVLIFEEGTVNAPAVVVGDEPGPERPAVLTFTGPNAAAAFGTVRVGDDAEGELLVTQNADFSAQSMVVGGGPGFLSDSLFQVRNGGEAVATTLTIGEQGKGSVAIESQGVISATLMQIATQPSPDEQIIGGLEVVGAGSIATTGTLTVGAGGRALVGLRNGGFLTADRVTISGTGDLPSFVDVEGVQNNNAARMEVFESIVVGDAGPGQLSTVDGGEVSAGTEIIIGRGGAGFVRLKNGDKQSINLKATGDLVVGDDDDGTLTLEEGARAQANQLFIGRGEGDGAVTLDPLGAGTPSELTIGSATVVGASSSGILNLINDASVETGNLLIIGDTRRASGLVRVLGKGSAGALTSGLFGGQEIAIGSDGKGTIDVQASGFVTTDFMVLGKFSSGRGLLTIATEPGQDPSIVEVSGTLTIGAIGSGRVIVTGRSTLRAANDITVGNRGKLELGRGSRVEGSVLISGRGKIMGRVVAPKQEDEGPAVIDGDFLLNPGSVLSIEVNADGSPPLLVTGDMVLAGVLEVSFPPGFDPQAGSDFQLLASEGLVLSGALVRFPGRSEDAEGTLSVVDGVLQVRVDNPGEALPTDLPVALVGVITHATTEQAIPCAVVELTTGDGSFRITAVTDTNGRYFFEPQEEGTYDLRVIASGFASITPDSIEFIDDAEPIEADFELTPVSLANAVTGRVADSVIGEPLVGVLVEMRVNGETVADTFTCADGRYAIAVPGGNTSLRFSLDNFAVAIVASGVVAGAEIDENLDPLEAGEATLVGIVLGETAADPIPLDSARITLRGPINMSTESDLDGSYVLDELLEGSYSVTASAPGFAGQSVQRILGDGLGVADFLLTPTDGFVDPGIPGDINGDGEVNAVDVQLVINAALGIAIQQGFNADINGDGAVNAVDVQLVINAALGVTN